MGQVLVEKSAGNPFFFRQLLYALEADGLLIEPLPSAHVMHEALDMQVAAIGKLALGHQRHLCPVGALGILGAVDKAGHIPAIEIAKALHLLAQRQPATESYNFV